MTNKIMNVVAWTVAGIGVLVFEAAHGANWTVSGLLREEIAAKTTSDLNANNQQGNVFDGVAVPNTGLFAALVPTLERPASQRRSNDYNEFVSRLELDITGQFGDSWSARLKLRGIGDEVGRVDKAFEGRNIFEQEFYGRHRGAPLEVNGRDWMFDLPAAYVDYTSGPLWLRFGNQQIAWGEALFFRVADVPNGLDLRRHSIFGIIAEEYADTRVAAPGARGSYRFNDAWEFEAFAQLFQPSIMPGQNSPYNTLPAQFTVHEREGFDAVRRNWNFGGRLRGEIGDFGVQLFAVHRNNPDGVYQWTVANGAGAMPGTAFQGGTGTGVFSAAEWFRYASLARLDGIGALNVVLNEFPGTVALGANMIAAACGAPASAPGAVAVDRASASCILDTFFTAADLRAHIVRNYPRETIVGLGINHVFAGAPDTLIDQLIGRFEISYTPNKKFTNPTLSRQYVERNETQFAFILEKHHKFSSRIPATYVVAQWLHKSASDLLGRALDGVDNTPGSQPRGQGNFNALALALQQPSPTLAWRFDLSALTDLRGGWLLQPGTRWKPNKAFQLDVYANLIESGGGQRIRNFAQGLDYANEVFVRGTYSF